MANENKELLIETEAAVLKLIKETCELKETKNNPEMVKSLAGLFEAIKEF